MALATSTSEWRTILRASQPGDHILFWGDGPQSADEVFEIFLRGSMARDDLLGVVLPRKELAGMFERFRSQGIDLARLEDEGHLVSAASEDLFPRDLHDVTRITSALEGFHQTAAARGKAGVTLFGRVAPVFFERGDTAMAQMIEGVAHANRGSARILCAYDTRRLSISHLAEATAQVRLHTHTLTALRDGRIISERVPPASRH